MWMILFTFLPLSHRLPALWPHPLLHLLWSRHLEWQVPHRHPIWICGSHPQKSNWDIEIWQVIVYTKNRRQGKENPCLFCVLFQHNTFTFIYMWMSQGQSLPLVFRYHPHPLPVITKQFGLITTFNLAWIQLSVWLEYKMRFGLNTTFNLAWIQKGVFKPNEKEYIS